MQFLFSQLQFIPFGKLILVQERELGSKGRFFFFFFLVSPEMKILRYKNNLHNNRNKQVHCRFSGVKLSFSLCFPANSDSLLINSELDLHAISREEESTGVYTV